MKKTFNKTGTEFKKKKIGLLSANCEKTKIMELMTQNFTLEINNPTFATVDELGSTVNSINNIRNTIWHWILFSNKCYFSSINVLQSKNISTATSSKLYQAVTCPVVMHVRCRTWGGWLSGGKTCMTFEGRILRIIWIPVLEDNQ